MAIVAIIRTPAMPAVIFLRLFEPAVEIDVIRRVNIIATKEIITPRLLDINRSGIEREGYRIVEDYEGAVVFNKRFKVPDWKMGEFFDM